MSLQDLTDSEEQTLIKLLDQVEEYMDETSYERCAKEVDNGFYYDYGSITNAWHSQTDIEINEEWGELTLDTKGIPDYILDHLVQCCNEDYGTVTFSIGDYEDHVVNAKWHWGRVKGETYLQCEVS